jgi:hypothetical protein
MKTFKLMVSPDQDPEQHKFANSNFEIQIHKQNGSRIFFFFLFFIFFNLFFNWSAIVIDRTGGHINNNMNMNMNMNTNIDMNMNMIMIMNMIVNAHIYTSQLQGDFYFSQGDFLIFIFQLHRRVRSRRRQHFVLYDACRHVHQF